MCDCATLNFTLPLTLAHTLSPSTEHVAGLRPPLSRVTPTPRPSDAPPRSLTSAFTDGNNASRTSLPSPPRTSMPHL
eukprot:CAMPEP_0174711008 /NCGR_PEP_ID=MMETSP1094-20130205/12458_1 /TAXON_ID=156173 /ORGANISM="Chrysochromulina brevifilum, Strain UTEX LB 985" /LENGTH=76 /DNA_ID=CAMNT_0015909887 /DNA_START=117 /DNA_END=344 /DNA_ORIENTATION=-